MRERESKRSERERGSRAVSRSAPSAPTAEAMLAVQRSAGNQALVQRLVFSDVAGALKVPSNYASQEIAWDGERVPNDPRPGHRKPLLEHARNDNFKQALAHGLGLGYVNAVGASSDAMLDTFGAQVPHRSLNNPNVPADLALYQQMSQDAATAAKASNKMLTVGNDRFKTAAELAAATRPVTRPQDFLPGVPDLPPAGTDLLTTKIPNDPDDGAYITYACVLFALLRDNGYAKAKKLTKKKPFPTDRYKAVQALHDHYVTANVQYDDGSGSLRVMKEWGYSLVWGGETTWEGLANEVTLPPGDYIFDITGHTTFVTVLGAGVVKGTPIVNGKTVFKPESDGKNYTKDKEWKQKVTAIWKK